MSRRKPVPAVRTVKNVAKKALKKNMSEYVASEMKQIPMLTNNHIPIKSFEMSPTHVYLEMLLTRRGLLKPFVVGN